VKAMIAERTTSQPIGSARVSSVGGIQAITAMRTTERCGIVSSGERAGVYLKRLRPILLILAIFLSSSTTQTLGTRILTSNPTMMATKTNFMDLPAELRNQIYEDCVSDKHPIIKLDNLHHIACSNPLRMALALGLKQHFPIIFASKHVLQESLPFCLQACNVYVHAGGHLLRLASLQHLPTFQKTLAHIRALTLDLSTINDAVLDSLVFRIPSPIVTRMPRVSWQPIIPTDDLSPPLILRQRAAFTKLLEELRRYFPNVSALQVFLDQDTIRLQGALKTSLPDVAWPSLRAVKVRRPDLECNLAFEHGRMSVFGRHQTVWPAQRIPWALDMDLRFLEHVNEQLAEVMRKKGKGNEAGSRSCRDEIVWWSPWVEICLVRSNRSSLL
jgi:hypothetical protein